MSSDAERDDPYGHRSYPSSSNGTAPEPTPDLTDIFGPPISTYTRAQAIEDGSLVDITETAKEAGITHPCAITHAAWAKYVEVPKGVRCQDERGRLWDVIYMLSLAIRNHRGGSTLHYRLHVRKDNRERTPPLVTLKCICGPGDTPDPVLTIMLPDED